jgi:hypothetical protein
MDKEKAYRDVVLGQTDPTAVKAEVLHKVKADSLPGSTAWQRADSGLRSQTEAKSARWQRLTVAIAVLALLVALGAEGPNILQWISHLLRSLR